MLCSTLAETYPDTLCVLDDYAYVFHFIGVSIVLGIVFGILFGLIIGYMKGGE